MPNSSFGSVPIPMRGGLRGRQRFLLCEWRRAKPGRRAARMAVPERSKNARADSVINPGVTAATHESTSRPARQPVEVMHLSSRRRCHELNVVDDRLHVRGDWRDLTFFDVSQDLHHAPIAEKATYTEREKGYRFEHADGRQDAQ